MQTLSTPFSLDDPTPSTEPRSDHRELLDRVAQELHQEAQQDPELLALLKQHVPLPAPDQLPQEDQHQDQ